MNTQAGMLSIIETADMCSVARSTVSYWITQKGLNACLTGNKFMVAIEDLVIFLEANGKPVPQALVESLGGVFSYPFKPYRNCWDYWENDPHGKNCKNCATYRNRINECFTMKNSGTRCNIECARCRYFYEHYTQYISFIHQMSMPVAIFRDMYIWSGNRAWADMCNVDPDILIGMGVEEIIHPESIRVIIDFNKRLQQGNSSMILKSQIRLESGNGKEIRVNLTITPLKQPERACFAVAENVSG